MCRVRWVQFAMDSIQYSDVFSVCSLPRRMCSVGRVLCKMSFLEFAYSVHNGMCVMFYTQHFVCSLCSVLCTNCILGCGKYIVCMWECVK